MNLSGKRVSPNLAIYHHFLIKIAISVVPTLSDQETVNDD